MKRILKWTVAVIVVLILALVPVAFLGKKQTLGLSIEHADFGAIPDGVYTGSYNCYRWSAKVDVIMKNHIVTDIRILKAQSGRESITDELINRIKAQNRNDVDAVSGATADSKAFLKAVENGLREAMK